MVHLSPVEVLISNRQTALVTVELQVARTQSMWRWSYVTLTTISSMKRACPGGWFLLYCRLAVCRQMSFKQHSSPSLSALLSSYHPPPQPLTSPPPQAGCTKRFCSVLVVLWIRELCLSSWKLYVARIRVWFLPSASCLCRGGSRVHTRAVSAGETVVVSAFVSCVVDVAASTNECVVDVAASTNQLRKNEFLTPLKELMTWRWQRISLMVMTVRQSHVTDVTVVAKGLN